MKNKFWLFIILLFPLIVAAEDSNVFTSKTAGFSITKPAKWYFATLEEYVENLNRVRLEDKKLQVIMQKHRNVPLVIMTKFQDSYDDLNPSVKVGLRPIGNMEGKNLVDIIRFVNAPLKKVFKDYTEIQPPVEKEIAGFKSAYMKVHYTLEDSEGRKFAVCSELWLIPRGKFIFLIGVGTNQKSDENEQQEIKSIINSIKIDK